MGTAWQPMHECSELVLSKRRFSRNFLQHRHKPLQEAVNLNVVDGSPTRRLSNLWQGRGTGAAWIFSYKNFKLCACTNLWSEEVLCKDIRHRISSYSINSKSHWNVCLQGLSCRLKKELYLMPVKDTSLCCTQHLSGLQSPIFAAVSAGKAGRTPTPRYPKHWCTESPMGWIPCLPCLRCSPLDLLRVL